MPALPPIAGVVKIEYIGTYGTAGWANIMHVHYSGSTSDANVLTLANDMEAAFHSRFMPRMSSLVTLNEVIATDLTSSTSPRQEAVFSGAVGTLTGTPLPASIAQVVSWKIARRYRGGHPRTYITGQTADQTDGEQLWLPASNVAMAAAAADFKADVEGLSISGFSPIVLGSVSYRTANAPRVTPIFDAFVVPLVHQRIDSQRRRLGKEHT